MDGSSFLASFKSSASSSKDMIQFSGAVDSFPIKGDEVNIVPSCGDHEMGSSKLQTSNIVNYGWDFQYCHGQLVAVHKSGSYFAYGLVSPGKSTGMVRVVQKKTDQRVLIKGMKGKVKDLAFAHCIEEIILGIVDEFGNLFVAKIEQTNEEDSDNDKPLQTELVLQINAENPNNSETHRIFWCPFLPEEGENTDDSSKLLLLTHGSSAEIWNVDLVISNRDLSNVISSNDVTEAGKLVVNDHGDTIMDASFSPDGTALATASADGQVKFFQVYMKGSESPRRLHQWKPHDGQPVSCLFFLDNHRDHNPDQQIWKYALTGCCQNNELKLWSCENWTCLQTVQFNANDGKRVALQAVMDITAQYLLLSDINRKNVYVLQLQHDHENDKVKFVSVSEFATPSPLLSMAMLEAGVKKVTDKHTLDDSDDEDDLDDLQAESREATVINFLLVQPKSLQECRIVFEDAFSQPQINLEAVVNVNVKKEVITPTEELKEAADKITLMSPEVFVAAPQKIKEEPVSPPAEKEPVPVPRRGQAVASGGSSPSREVQDILGDTEAEGGLGAEVVITEEDDEDDDEEDIITDLEAEDSDELSNMLDKCNESIKKEFKPEPLGLRIKQEAGLRIKEEKESPSSNSAWRGVKTEPTCWPIKPEPASSPVLAGTASGSSTSIDMILNKLNDMTHMIQTQRSEMQMLKEEMKHMHREDLTVFRSLLEESNREAVGELKATTGILVNSIKGNLKNSINEEIRKATPLLVQAAHQSIQEALAKEVHGKVLKSDLHLKEAVAKLASNRAVSEGIANNVATSLTPSLHASFKDALISTLVPAFERTIQTLFGQLSNTFNKGLKDYESQLKSHVNKQLEPVIRDLKAADKSKTSTDLEKKLTNVIRSEMRNITSSTPQGSPATPSPAAALTNVVNIEADIKQKLMEGKVNEAFSTALNAKSLPIVVSTCEKVNPNQIFHQNPCPLSQEVLVSLIQQLAHNLESYTDLKLNYLNEAVPSLEPNNESTKMHIPKIMSGVLDQLTKFARNNPNKKVKMLTMAVQGLTKNS